MKSRKNISAGTVFSDWTVLAEVKSLETACGTKKRMFCVRCKCGNIKTVQLNNLVAKTSQRCSDCGTKLRAAKLRGARTPDGLVNKKCAYGRYQQGAKKRKLTFNLTFEEFVALAAQNCHYCNSKPSNCYNVKHSKGNLRGQPRGGAAFVHNGIDRVDSKRGYAADNCVPCCRRCNMAKNDMTTDEFFDWITAVHTHTTKRSTNGAPVPSRNL
jgi:hypothetical protein